MKGLYLALMDLEALPGYREKIYGQVNALNGSGISTELIYVNANPSVVVASVHPDGSATKRSESIRRLPFNNRIQFYRMSLEYLRYRKPDLLYLRHSRACPFLIAFLIFARVSQRRLTILAEVPTYPYDQIGDGAGTIRARCSVLVDKVCRTVLRLFYDRVVSIGYQANIFGVKTISIGNGIAAGSLKLKQEVIGSHATLKLIGVCRLEEYHGYDRLVETIRLSIARADQKPEIEFHIVGPSTPALVALKRQVDSAQLNARVFFHGAKQGADLDELFDECHLAVGSLAWHRVGVEHHSNLKTREYMARGIPFIYSGCDDQLAGDFQYASRVPANEAPIDSELLYGFAGRVLADKNHSRNMRKFATEALNWTVVFAPVIEYIKQRKN